MSISNSFTDTDQNISLEFFDDHLTVLRVNGGDTSLYPFSKISLASGPIPKYPMNSVALTIYDGNTQEIIFNFSSDKPNFEIFLENLINKHIQFIKQNNQRR